MPHWKIILSYDGTPYHGWQIQPDLPTVQGLLSKALQRITGETVLPQGSGRTDAGVHALGQVASFTLDAPIPAPNLHRALNNTLPPSIRVLAAESVEPGFHARHSALRKTYEYRIFSSSKVCSPMLAPYVWTYHRPLDLALLNQAAAYVIGTHDFTSFAAIDPDLTTRAEESIDAESLPPSASESLDLALSRSAVRTIFSSCWHQQDDLFLYQVTGSGFLHHMVRNLVGTFVEAASQRISPDDLSAILGARNRNAAGPTAPASGLFLVNVEY